MTLYAQYILLYEASRRYPEIIKLSLMEIDNDDYIATSSKLIPYTVPHLVGFV